MNKKERESIREAVTCVIINPKKESQANQIKSIMELFDVMAGKYQLEDDFTAIREQTTSNLKRCDKCLGWAYCPLDWCWYTFKLLCLFCFCMMVLSCIGIIGFRIIRIFV